ncbi:MAG: tripartite tricarboxylate transporter substrate-binding protein, partial [Oscillospiraceae bacterium]
IMKKWQTILFAGAIAVVLLLAGCGGQTSSESSAPESTAPESTAPESSAPSSAADAYPEKPITFLIPANPGGNTDLSSRVLAKYLEKQLGQPIIISNQSGSGGTIAANTLFACDNDGYTLYYWHNSLLVSKIAGVADFISYEAMDPVAIICTDNSQCFWAQADAPFDNIAELVDYAKAHPGEVSIGIETGGSTHLLAVAFNDVTGADLDIIDVGSDSQKVQALLAGEVTVIPTYWNTGKQYVESGDFKCLGMDNTGGGDNPLVPAELTTAIEQGVDFEIPGLEFTLYAPKGTDPAIIQKLSDAVKAAVEDPDCVADLADISIYPTFLNVEDTRARLVEIYDGYAKYADLMQAK